AFGCKCDVVAIRGGHRMARGWRYTKPSLDSAPICVTRARICAMHPFYLWVPCPPVHPTYPFWYLLSCYSFLSFCRFCLVFVTMLSLALCRYSSDIFCPADHVPD
ncbi:unnamed protein product, partial [Ascophyllum nodosum]